jgi:hypothetical protein|tara:strand:- start:10713 stop:10907 length:195 start_codon:yes stop_codon:yes gene_type:complete
MEDEFFPDIVLDKHYLPTAREDEDDDDINFEDDEKEENDEVEAQIKLTKQKLTKEVLENGRRKK